MRLYFNPRPCARGDHILIYNLPIYDLFQSTPLREGRHSKKSENGLLWDISIHAPARGATPIVQIAIRHTAISIHAPARGATLSLDIIRQPFIHFNPRPCARGDSILLLIGSIIGISIHAPARGATNVGGKQYKLTDISIHAPARGATCNQYMINFRQ